MRTLAKYAFSEEAGSASESMSLFERATKAVENWLESKGASLPLNDKGSFRSRTKNNSEGAYERSVTESSGAVLWEMRLEEFTDKEQLFATTVSIYRDATRVEVFVVLASESTGSAVSPLIVHPKCPKVVRALVEASLGWKLHGKPIPKTLARIEGEEQGRILAEQLLDESRVHPVVVVSDLDGEELLVGLGEKLAFDLFGLADVCAIDDEASWALSEKLGKINSCYLGAVRLYWPVSGTASKLYSSVWTAAKLLPESEEHDQQAMDRLANSLRQRVMGASSEAIVEPRAISRFRSRWREAQLKEIAKANDNSAKAKDLESRIGALESELKQAKNTISRLYAQIEEMRSASGIEDESSPQRGGANNAPKDGEVRFYKKTHSKSNYDVLVHIADCGHSAWQNAGKADKAKKGIIRLEGSDQWRQVQHCGSCDGGGVWRVKW